MNIQNKGIALIEYFAKNYSTDIDTLPNKISEEMCLLCDNINDLVYSFKNTLINMLDLLKGSVDYRVNEITRFSHHVFEIKEIVSSNESLRIFELIDRFTEETAHVTYKRHIKTRNSYHNKRVYEWICTSRTREDRIIRYAVSQHCKDPIIETGPHGIVVVPGYIHPLDICIPDVQFDNNTGILTVIVHNVSFSYEKLVKISYTESFQLKNMLMPSKIQKKDISKSEWQKSITCKADFYKHNYNLAIHDFLVLEPLYNGRDILIIHGKNMDDHEILIRQNKTWIPINEIIDISDNIKQEIQMALNIISAI